MRVSRWLVLLTVGVAGLVGCATQDMELSNEGFRAISEKNYGQAETSLEKALSINPDNPYALLNMGVVYQETGRLDKARQMYEKLIALQPKEVAEQSNTDSLAGKGLADIARENLKLLGAKEAELTAGRKPVEPAPQATSTPPDAKATTTPPPEVKAPAPVAAAPPPAAPAALPPAAPPAAAAVPSLTESLPPAKEAFYKVRKNESLLDIAGRQEVYGDALKWVSLFRLNMSALEKMKMTDNLPAEKLPEGLRIKYVSKDEASERLVEVADRLWVVDVASARSMNAVVPYAVLLMKKGYRAYLTKSQLAGEEWTRLRVGFYKDILEALKVSEGVKALLNMSETPMPMKIDRKELERFAAY
jgi:tetratricopeptide (TPR) repeat protein